MIHPLFTQYNEDPGNRLNTKVSIAIVSECDPTLVGSNLQTLINRILALAVPREN